MLVEILAAFRQEKKAGLEKVNVIARRGSGNEWHYRLSLLERSLVEQ